MISKDIVTLEISSWVGLSVGASHIYGNLKGYNDEEYQFFEVVRTLSAKEARILNAIDSHISYEEGQETKRFDKESDVIDESIKSWKSCFPKAKVLVLGQWAMVEPKIILDGISKKSMDELNKLTRAYEKIEDDSWKRQAKAYNAWVKKLAKAIK